jgi:hypothetical protein
MKRIRRRFRVLFLAAALAAVPVGFALSSEFEPLAARATHDHTAITATAVSVPTGRSLLESAPDATMLLALGTVLLGLAAAVRRTT